MLVGPISRRPFMFGFPNSAEHSSYNLLSLFRVLLWIRFANESHSSFSCCLCFDVHAFYLLVHLGLMVGNLEGTLPTEIGRFSFIQDLVVADNNNLNGTIPTHIGLCKQLRTLDLAYNDLEGNLPSEIGALKSLEMLKIGGNKVAGTVPYEICALRDESLVTFETPCRNNFICPSTCCKPTCF